MSPMAADATSAAMKPPPGALWPRMNRTKEMSRRSGPVTRSTSCNGTRFGHASRIARSAVVPPARSLGSGRSSSCSGSR